MNYENLDRMVSKRRGSSTVKIHSMGCSHIKGKAKQETVRYCEYHETEHCAMCKSECSVCGQILPAGYLCDSCDGEISQ